MHMHHVLGINVASRYSLSVKSLSLFFYVWKNVSLCTRIIARELLKSSRYFISRKISKFHFSNIFQKLKDNFQISTPSCFHFHRISTVNIFYYRNIYSWMLGKFDDSCTSSKDVEFRETSSSFAWISIRRYARMIYFSR